MQSSVRALIWYFWRRSRWHIALPIVLIIYIALLAALLPGPPAPNPDPDPYRGLAVTIFYVVLYGAFLFVHRKGPPGVPSPYLMTLPLSMKRYAVVFHGYVIGIIGAISCALAWSSLHKSGNVQEAALPDLTFAFWQLPFVCVCLTCLVQGLSHVSATGDYRLLIPAALAATFSARACVLSMLDSEIIFVPALVALALAWACSYYGLTAYRCGWSRSSLSPSLTALLDWGSGRTRTFASPGQALFWFGWRRHGCVLFAAMSAVLLFHLALDLMHIAKDGDMAAADLADFVCLPFAFFCVLVCYVTMITHDRTDFLGSGSAYFLTLPVRSAAIARGRVLATALSLFSLFLLATALLFLIGLALSGLAMGLFPVVSRILPPAAVAWIVVWSGFLFVPTAGISDFVCTFIPGVPIEQDTLTMLLVTLLAAVLLADALRRGVLGRTDASLMAAAWFVAIVLGVCLVQEMRQGNIRFWLATLLIPLPFVAVPLAIDSARHR